MELQHLGPLEQKILKIIWRTPDLTVGQILTKLNHANHGRTWAYTTVLTITQRLAEKQLIECGKIGRSYTFRPKPQRPDFIKQLVKTTIRGLTERFGDQAIAAFLAEAEQLSEAERARAARALSRQSKATHE